LASGLGIIFWVQVEYCFLGCLYFGILWRSLRLFTLLSFGWRLFGLLGFGRLAFEMSLVVSTSCWVAPVSNDI
jgi:hypothetical protein